MFIRYVDENGNNVRVDIDNMSYSELLDLKERVSGLPAYSVVCGIISDKINDEVVHSKTFCDVSVKKFKHKVKSKKHRKYFRK